MRKFGFVLAALAAVFLVTGGTAHAQKRAKVVVTATPAYGFGNWWSTMPWTVRDPKLADSNFVVGAGSTAAYFAIKSGHKNVAHGIHSGFGAYAVTSFACAAVSPIVGTIVTQRELNSARSVRLDCQLRGSGSWRLVDECGVRSLWLGSAEEKNGAPLIPRPTIKTKPALVAGFFFLNMT